jgi:hypothetical protein
VPDRSDVEQALAALIAGLLYPAGSDSASITGDAYRIYRGWPVAGLLEADLAQGVAHVSVLSVAGTIRETTRYPCEWQGQSPTATLLGTISGQTVSFSGYGGSGQVAGVSVDGRCYAYRMRDGDSAALVSAALAAQIRSDRPAVASGSSLFLLDGNDLIVRVVVDGQGGREVRRQVAGFRVTFWCPNPALRDLVVSQVDTAIADTPFIDIGGWACRLRASGDTSSDDGSAAGIWRRDLLYSVEYPTVVNETLPAMLFGITDVNSVPFVG